VLTFWLATSLGVATLGCLLVPWAWLAHYTLRLLGAALFGPHMRLVGQWLKAREAEACRNDHAYRVADDEGKRLILDTFRTGVVRQMEARLATLREDQAAAHTAAYAQYLHEAKHVLALSPSRITTHLKYQALPDPHRSTATPLETGAPSRAPEAQQAGQAAGSASASPPAASHSPLHSPLHSRLHSRAAGEGIATDGWPEDDTWPEGDEEERSKALAASRLQALLRGRSASSRAQLAATRLAADVAGGLTAELLQGTTELAWRGHRSTAVSKATNTAKAVSSKATHTAIGAAHHGAIGAAHAAVKATRAVGDEIMGDHGRSLEKATRAVGDVSHLAVGEAVLRAPARPARRTAEGAHVLGSRDGGQKMSRWALLRGSLSHSLMRRRGRSSKAA